MEKEEIGGFVYIGPIAYPLICLSKKAFEKALKDYEGMTGVPHAIYVMPDDKFYLFPQATNDWKMRYFASNNTQIHTSCFQCEK
jgi:hypothetical protein